MTEAAINTFTGGLDLDTDLSLISPSKYREATNFRLVSTNSTYGALETVLGTTLIGNVQSYITGSVVAYCWMRDDLVLFTTGCEIQVFSFTADFGSISSVRTAYSNPELSFNTSSRIKVIARYETEDIQKIYWTDGVNPVRFANIASSNTELAGYNLDKLEFLPASIASWFTNKITVNATNVVSGFYTTGKVQYGIQLATKAGVETPIFINPAFYHVAIGSENSNSDKDYVGGILGQNGAKGFVVTASNLPVGFDKIKLIAIKYNSYNQEPTINIVAETSIVGISSIKLTDLGNVSLGTFTLEELSILSTALFTAKDIETKNDVLFAANINRSTWDVNFDARAYRFAGADNTDSNKRGKAGIWSSAGAFTEVVKSGSNFYLNGTSNPVPTTHDCVNLYNDRSYEIAGTYETRYRYQSNAMSASPTLGGEGPNIKYKFNIKLVPIASGTTQPLYVGNTSGGPGSALKEALSAGYQRGEIYRFGIVFHNDRGQSSSVKWIGDIRFPDISDLYSGDPIYIGDTRITITTYQVSIEFNDILYACVLVPNFTLINSPSFTNGYTIVRAHRDAANKTVLCNGLFGGLLYNTSKNLYYPPAKLADQYDISNGKFYYDNPNTNTYNVSYDADTLSKSRLEFISPDINIDKNVSYSSSTSDYLVYNAVAQYPYGYRASDSEVYTYTNYIDYGGTINPSDPHLSTLLHGTISAPNSAIKPIYKSLQAFEIAGKCIAKNSGSLTTEGSIAVGSSKYRNSIVAGNQTYHGTVGVMITDSDISTLGSNMQSPLYGSYIRLNTNIYYGPGYSSRLLTEYYPCTSILSTGAAVDVYGGDTFISMFEYVRALTDLERKSCFFSVYYFPVESPYNLSLRSGTTYKNSYGQPGAFILQEEAGVYSTTWNSTSTGNKLVFTQLSGLYDYNSVYSQQNKSTVHFQKDESIIETDTFDYRVLYSDTKINGETIDSWVKFRSGNYRDVDSTYGSVNILSNYNNQLYFMQDNAFGILAVNQREILPSSGNVNASLVIGTGGILDRYDYISYEIGGTDNLNIVKTNVGLYWLDLNRKVMLRYSNSLELLSKSKLVSSFFKDITSAKLGYDPKFNEIYITSTQQNKTLVFSEIVDVFMGFYKLLPSIYYNGKNILISSDSTYKLWSHKNVGEPGRFYTDTQTYSSLGIVCNDKYMYTKVFDNIEYESEATKQSNQYMNSPSRTFNSLKCTNSYQNTGNVELVYNTNLKRKDRGFTLAIPRNAVSSFGGESVDLNTTLDTSRLFKERLRDKYLNINLTYTSTDTDFKLRIPYLITKYRLSDR